MRLVSLIYLVYLLLPMALLVVGSLGQSWTNTMLPTGTTGRWYLEVASDPSFRRAFVTSLWVVGATCVINTLIGLPFAYAIYASAHRGARLAARIVFLMPIAAPELVLAFGFILVFSTDAFPWLGTLWLLIAAHVVLTIPYLLNTLVADMDQLQLGELERMAEVLGAGFWRRFFDIVVPTLRHSLLSGLIMVAAISIGEFQLSNLVAGFLNRTYPVVLLQAFYGATGFACAATVVLLLLATLAAAAATLTAHSAQAGQEGRA